MYELLLKHPDKANPKLSATACKALLNGDGAAPSLLSLLATAESSAGCLTDAPVIDPDIVFDEDEVPLVVATGLAQDVAVAKTSSKKRDASHLLGPGAKAPSVSSASSISSMSSESAESDDSIVGDEEADTVPAKLPNSICGQHIHREHHVKRVGDEGIRIRCNNPAHPRCKKFRALRLDKPKAGHVGAVGFLGAWLAQSQKMPAAEHQKFKPSKSQVLEYLSSLPSPS